MSILLRAKTVRSIPHCLQFLGPSTPSGAPAAKVEYGNITTVQTNKIMMRTLFILSSSFEQYNEKNRTHFRRLHGSAQFPKGVQRKEGKTSLRTVLVEASACNLDITGRFGILPRIRGGAHPEK
jgi:hypothetical protein